jgi:FimV-like protein
MAATIFSAPVKGKEDNSTSAMANTVYLGVFKYHILNMMPPKGGFYGPFLKTEIISEGSEETVSQTELFKLAEITANAIALKLQELNPHIEFIIIPENVEAGSVWSDFKIWAKRNSVEFTIIMALSSPLIADGYEYLTEAISSQNIVEKIESYIFINEDILNKDQCLISSREYGFLEIECEQISTSISKGVYYLTQKGDTLSEIANHVIGRNKSISLEQMIIGIYANNLQAFENNSIHHLKTEVALKLPNADELDRISHEEAVNLIKSHQF